MFGPSVGSRHDSGIAQDFSVPEQVETVFGGYRVYADQGMVTMFDPQRSHRVSHVSVSDIINILLAQWLVLPIS